VKAGAKCAAVHRAAARELLRRGFETRVEGGAPSGFIQQHGHGLGLAVHEEPSIGRADGRLRSGNVVTVEPGLYYRREAESGSRTRSVVTPTGWRYLVPCEKRFEL